MLARNPVPIHAADREQARYFGAVLSARRAELEERVDALHSQLMKLAGMGDHVGLRSKRRIIRGLEDEVHCVDRMLKALRNRFGPDVEV